MLVAERLGWLGEGLPGCGPNSGCAKATASALGKLPFTVPSLGPAAAAGWPVSFLGFSFFLAMLGTWLLVGRRVPSSVVHMARLGMLASGFYLVMMLMNMNQYFCKYCLASHACNLVFWLSAEIGTRAGTKRAPGFLKAVVSAAAVFFASSVALGALDANAQEQKAAKQEGDLAAEIAAMQAQAAAQQAPPPAPAPAAAPKKDYPPIDIGIPIPADDTLKQDGFTGRYRLGPANAPIRVVIFSDYQCKDCKRVEGELRQVLKDMPNVSISHKQFAFDKTCNKYFDTLMHPNACWAARAAEAAGMMRGNAGFWQMHFWLFDRKTNGEDTPGAFTNDELQAGLKELGYDPAEFVKVMNSPETLALVQKDIDESVTYGIFSTPMIFVNGREFKAWQAPNAVKRYIEAVASTNPQPAPPTMDKPPAALDKAVEDWLGWPRQNLQRGSPTFTSGPAAPGDAKIRITLFGDFSEQYTPQLWEAIQKEIKGRTDVAITFYPRMAKETCNVMNQPPEKVPGCRMGRALESAGRLGGQVAYWKMFDWLMANGREYNEARLPEAAAAAGLDLETLKKDMDLEDLMFILVDSNKVFTRSGARGVPTVFVNERCVLRWRINDVPIIDRVIKMAETVK
jgi:protein-disulfide isomerase